MNKRGKWTSRFGFYLAAIGCAFGLGNLWRFPYIVSENGGGAFILLYVLLAFILGMPILVAELILGKSTRQSIIHGISMITKSNDPNAVLHGNFHPFLKNYRVRKAVVWFARGAVFLSLVLLSYYAVISGWVLHFFMRFFVGVFTEGGVKPNEALSALMNNGALQILLASVHILILVIVVAQGVKEGLEKWLRFVMPAFFVLLVILMVKSLSLNTGIDTLRFLFYPDFSKLTLGSMGYAVGHVFFTLSIGFGTMVTFGSYLRENDNVPAAGFRVTSVDIVISIFACLLVFPIVMTSGEPVPDPALLFKALPRFLIEVDGGLIFGLFFFLCLYLAALAASVGLLESIVANWVDRIKMSRVKATWVSGFLALLLAIIPALSTSVFNNVRWHNLSLLVIFDSLVINWLLPLCGLGVALTISFYLTRKEKLKHFVLEEQMPVDNLFSDWRIALRWGAPIFIAMAILLQIAGFIF